jgi:predicted ATPase
LCRRDTADKFIHFRALYGLAYAYLLPGDLRSARPLAEQLLDFAERVRDPELLAYAHFEMGCELFWPAEFAAAREYLERGITLYDPEWGVSATFRHAFNCASDCYAFLGRVLWLLGYPDQALHCSRRAVKIAEEISHPFSLVIALSWRAALHQLRREVARTRDVAEAALALATEQIIPFFSAHAMVLRGWALVEQGRCEEGIAQLRHGVDAYRATGADLESPHWLALVAEACGKAGEIEAGLGALAKAFDLIAQTGIVYYEAELHRIGGELRLARDLADASQAAERSFLYALEIARQQQAKSWELRAATSLARLWGQQGRRTEARDLLAPVYSWFTEGFDTVDLKDAKRLLDELT